MTIKLKSGLGFVSCLALLSGCNSDSNRILEELNENRLKWEALNVTSYQFHYTRSCECLKPATQTRQVLVDGGKVASQVIIATGEALSLESYSVQSVEDLFDMIAVEEGRADQLQIEYDADMGYPTRVVIDPDLQVADDEFKVGLSNMVLAEDIACTTVLSPGLSLAVIDADSLQAISCGVTVTAQHDGYTETYNNNLSICDDVQNITMLYESPGFYDIAIVKDGYSPTVFNDFGIGEGSCGVITRQLDATLTPE